MNYQELTTRYKVQCPYEVAIELCRDIDLSKSQVLAGLDTIMEQESVSKEELVKTIASELLCMIDCYNAPIAQW